MELCFENEDLVLRAQAGDQGAFNALFAHYRGRLARLMLRFTRNSWDAEDLVQDAFVRAYRGLGNFRHESSFYTWVCKIAINLAKTKYAARLTSPISLPDQFNDYDDKDEGLLKHDLDSPEDIVMTRQLAKIISVTIEQLPYEFKTTFFLREVDGLTYEQIADRMGCPIGTVRSRLARTRRSIAAVLIKIDENFGFLSTIGEENMSIENE